MMKSKTTRGIRDKSEATSALESPLARSQTEPTENLSQFLGFAFRFMFTVPQVQRNDSAVPRGGATESHDWQFVQRKQSSSSLNAVTTGSKSFRSKFAHS